MTVAVDRAALEEASENDLSLGTADGFAGRMAELEEVFTDIEENCSIEISITDAGNLQMTLLATSESTSDFCNEKSRVSYYIWTLASSPRKCTMSHVFLKGLEITGL